MSSLRELLARPVLEVAESLLGMRLRSTVDGVVTEIALTEVEAYNGAGDPASHAFGGPTPRTRSMFGAAGTLYVYRSYGLHWCMNVVTGASGVAAAVLLRGGTPTAGGAVMVERRGRSDHLTDGPGKLCQALGVTGHHDGANLLGAGPLSLLPGDTPSGVDRLPRIGITKAKERPWRLVAHFEDGYRPGLPR